MDNCNINLLKKPSAEQPLSIHRSSFNIYELLLSEGQAGENGSGNLAELKDRAGNWWAVFLCIQRSREWLP